MVDYVENQQWLNWSQGVISTPKRTYSPRNFEELRTVIVEARRDNKRVHAVGAGWSFTEVMTTDDYFIHTNQMRGILALSQGEYSWGEHVHGQGTLSPILPEALLPEVRRSDRRLIHVKAGTTIKEIYSAIEKTQRSDTGSISRDRWALPTMGGASGQTIAGAISTGTHGGDFNQPPIADMVQAIQILDFGRKFTLD